ncbi:MAG: hypothetical protein LBI54_09570 [Lachnospiraceae bacterium]|jgi:hypothetical protein|nr:hypothetical protein [Lachnospiraceae bacterium]
MIGNIGYKISSFIFLAASAALIANAAAYASSASVKDNTEKIESLHLIPEPVQVNLRPQQSASKTVDGVNVEFTFVAEYSISGRVIGVQDYAGTVTDSTSPRDVAIVWGVLTDQKAGASIIDQNLGPVMTDRTMYYRKSSWVDDFGGMAVVDACISNNHLIPSGEHIRELIMAIKPGDYVRIEGYLTNVKWDFGATYGIWKTSLSRTDGDDDSSGGCEVIYVTDVKWLKGKNYNILYVGAIVVLVIVLVVIRRRRMKTY